MADTLPVWNRPEIIAAAVRHLPSGLMAVGLSEAEKATIVQRVLHFAGPMILQAAAEVGEVEPDWDSIDPASVTAVQTKDHGIVYHRASDIRMWIEKIPSAITAWRDEHLRWHHISGRA